MSVDLTIDMMHATVQLEQPLGDGTRTVGAGFLVSAPTTDGKPRVVLVTAGHVLDRMPAAQARIGYRVQLPPQMVGGVGPWSFKPTNLTIRDGAKPLWTRHPGRDVAVLAIAAPPEIAAKAIPLSWLAKDATFDEVGLAPGDEMMALGFPRGLSANPAGFPILRAGRVASYPLGPSQAAPTFLLDFRVFPGNSGGPVIVSEAARRRPGGGEAAEVQFIAGLLTQQVELKNEPLSIGIVTHAAYVREAIEMLDRPGWTPPTAPAARPADGTVVAAANEASALAVDP